MGIYFIFLNSFDYFYSFIQKKIKIIYKTRLSYIYDFIISACIFKSRVLIASYITLAIVNFINLFYSYYYHNVIYNNPMAPKNILFDISSNYQLIFSVLSLIVFSIMLVVYFKNQRLFIKKK